MGVISALGVSAVTSGVASAATTSGSYSCATPLGTKAVPATITTLHNTTPKTVIRGTKYSAKPRLKATIPSSLIHTAHTATPSLTELPIAAATLNVIKHNLTGPAYFTGTKKATLGTYLAIVPINTTTEAHGFAATITYTAATFTVTSNSGKATLTPSNIALHVLVTLSCFPPSESIHYTTTGTYTHYTVSGTDTLGVITTLNAQPKITPVSLTPPAGALPSGQVGVHYTEPNYWTAVTGHGTNAWTATGVPGGLTFHGTGTHASLTGTPTAAGTFTIKVKVTTKTHYSATHTYTLHIAAAAATPVILQPFKLTVTPGSLTMTCGKGRGTGTTRKTLGHPTTPAVAKTATLPIATKLPVETQHLAKTCTLISFGSYKLAEVNHPITTKMHTLFISTARGGPTDDWTLNAVMVPTKQSLTGNPTCDTVQGFCNKTTTTLAKLATPHTYQNTTILPNYLGLYGYTCKAQRYHGATLIQDQYYNVNPTPTTTPGRNPESTSHDYGLSNTMTLCTAANGVSGGEFIVQTGTYTLIVPPNVYAGTYYGTVQFTLVASV